MIYPRSTNKTPDKLLLPYYLMRYEDDCREAGKLEDREEADRRMSVFMKECEKKAKMEMAKSLYADGMSIEKIVKYVKYPVEVIEQWLGLAKV